MSELSMIERILINIINRKQKTLYNMTHAHDRNILYEDHHVNELLYKIGPLWEDIVRSNALCM